jgi:hypothetical protein
MKRVRHGSVGSTLARCQAGPSSNPDSAPQGGFCHWAFQRWRNGEESRRMDVWMCVCMKEKLNKLKRVTSGHQTYKKTNEKKFWRWNKTYVSFQRRILERAVLTMLMKAFTRLLISWPGVQRRGDPPSSSRLWSTRANSFLFTSRREFRKFGHCISGGYICILANQ